MLPAHPKAPARSDLSCSPHIGDGTARLGWNAAHIKPGMQDFRTCKSAARHPKTLPIDPWIKQRNTRLPEIANVAGHQRKPMVQSRRGDNQIGLRESMSGLASFFDKQPPLEHHVLADRQHATVEHRAHLAGKPVIQFGSPPGVRNQFDPKPEFGKRDGADEQKIEGLSRDESQNSRFGSGAAQLRQNVRIEQPTRRQATSRTGMDARAGAMSISR